MTEKTQPTNAELWQLYMQQPGQHKDPIDFARAVLAKWGAPAPAGVEPVAWAATSEDGDVEALGMNQSRRFDTPPLHQAVRGVQRLWALRLNWITKVQRAQARVIIVYLFRQQVDYP